MLGEYYFSSIIPKVVCMKQGIDTTNDLG